MDVFRGFGQNPVKAPPKVGGYEIVPLLIQVFDTVLTLIQELSTPKSYRVFIYCGALSN